MDFRGILRARFESRRILSWRLALPLFLLPLPGCAAGPVLPPRPSPAVLHVRLVHLEQPVPGAAVSAVRNPGVAFREERVTVTAGSDGRAELSLAPGAWFISAVAADPALFGWSGSNPVHLREGEVLDLAVRSVPLPPPARVSLVPVGEEVVAGDVMGEEGPVAGASVAFYLDAATQFRGPGYLEVQTDGEGRFETQLTPGRYWLLARLRAGRQFSGPLEVGDAFGFYAGNPLVVTSGTRAVVRIGAVQVLKKSGWSGPSTLRTRVSGTIRDASSRPLPGYRAFLHASPAMLGKPEFVSEPSGPDGAYAIWVDREGTFYLGARAEIGKPRDAGESIGLYQGTADHAVRVRLGGGELRGFDVRLGAGETGP